MRAANGPRFAKTDRLDGSWFDDSNHTGNLEMVDIVHIDLANFGMRICSVLADGGFNGPAHDFTNHSDRTSCSMLCIY